MECTLAECHAEVPAGRKKFCSETHGKLHRSRGAPTPDVEAELRETADLRAALRRSQANLAKAKAKTDELVDAVYTAVRDQMASQPPLPAVPTPKLAAFKKDNAEIALIHTTDWQLGKKTKSYDMAKCASRMERLADKVGLLTSIQREAHPVRDITVLFGGDMVENLNIFPGQAYEVEAGLYEQMFEAVRIGQVFLRRMLSIFDTVHVVAEEGNHGRFGRRGDFPHTDNADMMVYEITRQSFASESRLTWQPRVSFYQPVTVGAYRAVLIHGDEIKSFGGNTPAYGLLRKGTAWASGVIPGDWKDLYFGHFHTPMELTMPSGGVMYGTGSTESDNVYAQEFVAAMGSPTQRLHYIDPKKGRVTARYTVYLDD